MNSNRRKITTAAALLGVVLVVLAGALARPKPLPDLGAAPGFTLTREDGTAVSFTSLRGRAVLLNFIYTSCKATCPRQVGDFVGVQKAAHKARLFDDRLVLLSITIDPARDTPAVLKSYGATMGADPRGYWFLTGTQQEIEALLKTYRFPYEKVGDSFGHAVTALLIDPAGHVRARYPVTPLDTQAVIKDVKNALGIRVPWWQRLFGGG